MTIIARPLAWAIAQSLAAAAQAATIVVDSTADGFTEDCTLRAAIVSANDDAAVPGTSCAAGDGEDLVWFDPGLAGATITLTGGPIQISSSVTVLGPPAGRVTISGGDPHTIFLVSDGTDLTSSLSARVGNLRLVDSGPAIVVRQELTVLNTEFTDNIGPAGAAISAEGGAALVLVANSTVAGNTAVGGGAGAILGHAGLRADDAELSAYYGACPGRE